MKISRRQNHRMLAILGWLVVFMGPIAAQQFIELVNVSNNPLIIETGPEIAMDPVGHAHIVWQGFYYNSDAPDGVASDIFYSNNTGGSFSPPVAIEVPTGWYSRDPSIAVDTSGNVHVAFRRSMDQMYLLWDDEIYYAVDSGAGFGAPVALVDAAGAPFQVKGASQPMVLCGPDGRVGLAMMAKRYGDTYQDFILYLEKGAVAWSVPVSVVPEGFSILAYHACLDGQGSLHVVVNDFSSIFYTNNVGGNFSPPVTVANPAHSYPSEGKVAVDSHRIAHVVYRAPYLLPPNIWYVNNSDGAFTDWLPVTNLALPAYLPAIAVDGGDFVHVVFKQFPAYGGVLVYQDNRQGPLEAGSGVSCDWADSGWFPTFTSRYFSLGNPYSINATFYQWTTEDDTDIFYLRGDYSLDPYDLNRDGHLDAADYAALADLLSERVADLPPGHGPVDFNDDGRVDAGDLSLLAYALAGRETGQESSSGSH